MKKIYLDSASTTYVKLEVLQEILPVLKENFGNPNNTHQFGKTALDLVDKARDRVSEAINSKPTEIFFTSSATESNNWAIKGMVYANKHKGNHIITSKIEHPSVMESFRQLESEGFKVTYLNVDSDGQIKFHELLRYLDNDTILVSIMLANNEVGTFQPIRAISNTVKDYSALFHVDAVQGFVDINLDVNRIGIDAMTVSSHKIYGPKGAGFLYIRKGTMIKNLTHGGTQEYAKRPGTVNVPAVVGMGKAVEIISRDREMIVKKNKEIKQYLISELKERIKGVAINGDTKQAASHIVSCSFEDVNAETLSVLLDQDGISISTGSACSVGLVDKSYVLKAMGLDSKKLTSTIRISITHMIQKSDIDHLMHTLEKHIKNLRKKR